MSKIKEWTFVGAGTFGQVTRAYVSSIRQNVAVKWIPVKHLPGHLTGQMDLEVQQDEEEDDEDATEYNEALEEFVIASLLGTTKAPAFLHFYGAFIASFSSASSGLPPALAPLVPKRGGEQYYLVQVSEYANVGTLDTLLQNGYEFPVVQASAIAFDLAWSFMIAHSNVGLRWHGDLQAHNIVFISLTPIDPISYELVTMDANERSLGRWSHTQHLRPCVIDFGFASYIVPNKMSVIGTDVATNTPPELYFNVPNNRSDRTDVWQLAILFFSLFAPQTTRLLKIRHDLNRGNKAVSKEDKQLNQTLSKRFIDLIDLPLHWITMLAEERGLKPPNDDDYMMVLEDDNDDAQAIMLSEQMNLGSRFVNLLYSLDDVCTENLANDLRQEESKSRPFARYISIGLLQAVLGNGWHPSPQVAEHMGYDQSDFYHCLLHPKVQAFWKRYILPPEMKLMTMMQGMVARLPVPVRTLMKKMMSWSPFDRPSCQEIVLDPWFASQLQPPPMNESVMYRVHARPILRMRLSANATEQEKQQWVWLAKKHAKLKQKFQQTSSVADSLSEMETLVEKSVVLLRE